MTRNDASNRPSIDPNFALQLQQLNTASQHSFTVSFSLGRRQKVKQPDT